MCSTHVQYAYAVSWVDVRVFWASRFRLIHRVGGELPHCAVNGHVMLFCQLVLAWWRRRFTGPDQPNALSSRNVSVGVVEGTANCTVL